VEVRLSAREKYNPKTVTIWQISVGINSFGNINGL
jgi:hypothetical protein